MQMEVLRMNSLRTLFVGVFLLTGVTVSHAQTDVLVDTLSTDTLTADIFTIMESMQTDTVVSRKDSVRHHTALRTNILYLATATPNLSVDFGFARHWSFGLTAGFNPFKYPARERDDNKTVNPKTLHWLVMPELRLWFREHLSGCYLGLHGAYAQYNIGGLSFISALNEHRYQGYLYGGGISFGWHLWLGKKHRTGLDLSLGAGYLRLHYDKYRACNCSGLLETVNQNYFGPTKAAISLTYMIK